MCCLQADADAQCTKVDPHSGKMQECLKDHRALLSWDCQEELFRQEVENADDLRLSVRLFKACLGDKKKVGLTTKIVPLMKSPHFKGFLAEMATHMPLPEEELAYACEACLGFCYQKQLPSAHRETLQVLGFCFTISSLVSME